ncbi:hypothetical protein RHMOL_Rhmol07G0249100 [Rhododendron molle]|uniref:Uncharacterized protein n=1 Tax=Rhododendron molle TaxID=49168 RepID=A0ACC0N6J0_RHOML|nr:hypothetical protein RHMOL_Rhmol07G0249100 [Rhododendron molle]
MDALYFDITVYFRGNVSRIKNVNPGRYTYVDLLDDVAEKSLSTIPCGNGCTITLKSKIPESNETIVVSCDLDVLDMFRFNSRTCQIELIVDVGEDGGTLEVGGQEGVRNDVMAHDVIDLSHDVVEGLTSEAHNVQRIEGVNDVGEGSTVGQFKSGQGDQTTQGQASQSEIPSQCVTQTESAVMTFTGSNEHAGSRGRGRTNGRGRGRGRNTSVTQNEGGRGSNENAGTRGRGRTNARGRGGRTDVGRGRGTSVSRGKGRSGSSSSLDIYFISAPTEIRIAVIARMKLASTNTFTMLIVASMINSLVLTLPFGITVSVSSVISRLGSWDVGLVCETLLIWLIGLHHAHKSQPPLSAFLHV